VALRNDDHQRAGPTATAKKAGQLKEQTMKTMLAMLMLIAPAAAAVADSDPDLKFYKKAAEAGIAEVDAGNLAQQKGNTQAVKDFGAMMVKDHSAANEKLQALAASKQISLPTSASLGEMATKAKLDILSGDTFDKSYIKSQIKDHRAAIALFQKEIASGQDPDAKAFASATLPTLKSHLKAIKTIAADEGVVNTA
jgi:putative membrane protein